MQFFNMVYSAVKHSRPLVQNFRVGISNNVSSCIVNQPFRAFSSRLDCDLEAILSSIPYKPKKPLGIYFRFVKMIEPQLIQKYPNAKRTEIIKTATEMYNTTDEETLLDLRNSYFDDMERYKKDVQEYESKLTEEQKEAMNKLKSIEKKYKIRRQLKKDNIATNKPKKPINPYLLFLKKRRAEETPTGSLLKWTKKVSEEWKHLLEDERNKFIAEAERLRQEYKNEMSKWEASLENTEYSHLITSKKSENETTNRKSESKVSKISKKSENITNDTKSKSKVSENKVSSAQKGKVPKNKE